MTGTSAGVPGVLLVGAGPGDPDLLTLRAEAALSTATLVLTDPSVAPLARSFAPRAEILLVGTPVEVAEVLAYEVGRGGCAVRVYRGDPWMHRAFGGEAAALRSLGVWFEAVPGAVAELASLAEAGIAVHHRPTSVTVTLALPGDLPGGSSGGWTLVAEEAS
jgi:siroheme synthase